MTLAVDQADHRRWHRSGVVTPTGVRATVRPLGASLVGFLAVLAAAWGAIAVFWGPDFGFRPTSATAWDWTEQNWLLHLIPGAVGVFAGAMILAITPRRRSSGGGGLELPALLLIGAGIWFVVGPSVWPTFMSTPPFATGVSTSRALLNVVGSSSGPGLLLAIFGGMALKAGIARPAVAVGQEPIAATATPVAANEPVTTSRPVAANEPVTAAQPVTAHEPVAAGETATGDPVAARTVEPAQTGEPGGTTGTDPTAP